MQIEDFTGPEESVLDVVRQQGGGALALFTRHTREFPAQGQRAAPVLHIPKASREECIPGGLGEPLHAHAIPTPGCHLHTTTCAEPSRAGP